MSSKITFSILALVLILSSCSKPQNWNQYLGPNRNNSIGETPIATSWPKEGPEKLWEVELGPGYGGASIFENEVFILDRVKGESDILRCFDLETGKEKWSFEYEAKGELPYPGSRIVPYVDKDFVYCVGPHGHMHCINKKTQQAVWSHNLMEEFEAKLPRWGFSQSPVLYNDLVIVAPQGALAGVTAFDKTSGELVWKSRALTGHNWHISPLLASYEGTDQVVIVSPYDRKDSTYIHEVVSFDANTGEELWTYDGLESFSTIAPPVIVGENKLFLTQCSYKDQYSPISILLEIGKEGEKFSVSEVFNTEVAGCKMHPGIVVDEHIYLNDNGKPNELVCLNMAGERIWEKKSAPNFEMGSMILVNGLIINQNGKNGDIHLIQPSPEGYKELGKATFFDSKKSQAWAPMAFSQGKLLVRDMEKMVCVNLE